MEGVGKNLADNLFYEIFDKKYLWFDFIAVNIGIFLLLNRTIEISQKVLSKVMTESLKFLGAEALPCPLVT
jgi:hypothetical protein